MSDIVVMAYVGDLFPQQREPPERVAHGIATHCPMDQYRNAETEVREVVRAAGEWQGMLKPPRKLFRGSAPPAMEADFMSAARRAYERFG
jgi:hypothetical protein